MAIFLSINMYFVSERFHIYVTFFFNLHLVFSPFQCHLNKSNLLGISNYFISIN